MTPSYQALVITAHLSIITHRHHTTASPVTATPVTTPPSSPQRLSPYNGNSRHRELCHHCVSIIKQRQLPSPRPPLPRPPSPRHCLDVAIRFHKHARKGERRQPLKYQKTEEEEGGTKMKLKLNIGMIETRKKQRATTTQTPKTEEEGGGTKMKLK